MGFREWLRGESDGPIHSERRDQQFDTITLDELERRFDIVEVDKNNGAVYVTDRQSSTTLAEPGAMEETPATGSEAVTKGEISGSSETVWRAAVQSDYNPELAGVRGIDKYREMKNDAVVRSSMRIAKTPILSARWFIEAASQEQADVERADFIWKNLTEWMSMSWPQFLIEVLYMLDYGVYAFEKVFDVRDVNGEQRIVWRKFAPRHPYEISEFMYDDEGGPEAIKILTDDGDVDLEIAKALIFTFDKEAGNLWGVSLLRSAYKHWFYKEQLYKIDAIQKERHGIGIPVIKLPVNFTKEGPNNDRDAAERIGTNLRTNEKAHVVLPPMWEVYFLKLEGQRIDALESAQHHADKLYENVLANFMIQINNASSGESDAQSQVFIRAVRFTAEIIRDVLNHYAIPQLCRYNWTEEELANGYPQLRARRLGDERDWRVISFALRNLVGAGAIRPDDRLEEWLREEMDMPVADVDTLRQIVTEVGMEDEDTGEVDDNNASNNSQSQAGNMRQAQSPGSSRGDSSGTSGTR